MCISRPSWFAWSLVFMLLGGGSATAFASDEEEAPPNAEVQSNLEQSGPELRPAASTPPVLVSSAASVANRGAETVEAPIPANVLYVRFSKAFLQDQLCQQYEQVAPVRDVILGADVSGRSRTVGRTELELLPEGDAAQAKLIFRGEVNFETVGVTGPVQIHSRGVTRFVSEKQLRLGGLDARQTPAVTQAETATETLDITTDLPPVVDRVVRRIATEREADTHAQAESITNERTKRKIEDAFDQRVTQYLGQFRKNLQAQYAQLPVEGRFTIREIRCRTTADMLEVVVLGRGDGEPTYAAAPAMLKDQPDVEVHLHPALLTKTLVNAELRDTVVAAVRGVIDGSLRAAREAPPERVNVPQVKVTALEHGDAALRQGNAVLWQAGTVLQQAGVADTPPAPSPPTNSADGLSVQWPQVNGQPWLSFCWRRAAPLRELQQASRAAPTQSTREARAPADPGR